MSSKPDRVFCLKILVLFSIILVTSCNMPTSTHVVDYPYCRLGSDLSQPVIEYPTGYMITNDLTPKFSWSYPGECLPDNNHIEIVRDDYRRACTYADEWDGSGVSILSEDIGGSTEWSPSSELEPLTMYRWRIAGKVRDITGEFSDPGCFWTGPRCSPDTLVAPVLIGPNDMSIRDLEYIVLVWEYTEPCLPDSFQPELAADPAFDGPNLMAIHDLTEIDPVFRQSSMPLADCTEYSWRVTARVGSSWGPISEVRTFTTDFDGTCSVGKADAESIPTDTLTPVPPPSITPTLKPVYLPPTNTPTSPPPIDTTPPPAPKPKSPKDGIILGCSSQTPLKWGAVTDPSGIAEYRVQLGTHSGDNNWHPPSGSPYTGISGTTTSVSVDCGWYYRWRVRAIDDAGNMGPLSDWAYFTITLE